MDITITINTDNAAFDVSPEGETARILTALAQQIEDGGLDDANGFMPVPITDYNGNKVGAITAEET